MKTTFKIVSVLCFLVVLGVCGCNGKKSPDTDQKSVSTAEDETVRRPKKVISVTDLVVQHMIKTVSESPDKQWVQRLKKMRDLDQTIRQKAPYHDTTYAEVNASVFELGEQVALASNDYIYMQSCCLCGSRCCGCTMFLISTDDVSSLVLTDTSLQGVDTATYFSDGPARVFNFKNQTTGKFTMNITFKSGDLTQVPVQLKNGKVRME